MNFKIRPIHHSDIDDILEIECKSFPSPWTKSDFQQILNDDLSVIGEVALQKGEIIGYVIYQKYDSSFHILNLAVAAKYTRQKVGTQLVDNIKQKLEFPKRPRIMVSVSERNLDGQCFFRANDFRCIKIEHSYYYNDDDQDMYYFQYQLHPENIVGEFQNKASVDVYDNIFEKMGAKLTLV